MAWCKLQFYFMGLYYAILLLIEKMFTGKYIEKLPKVLKMLYSLFFITLGWVIFRVENLNDLVLVIKKMFSFNNTSFVTLFNNNSMLISTIPYIILGIFLSLPIDKWFKEKVDKSNSVILTLIEDLILGVLFGISIMFLVSNSYNPFIYFRF